MDEHAFQPTGFVVAWFSCTYFAFVLCKEFVVVVFSTFAFCHLQDWMASLWMHTEYWVGMVGLSDHQPNCIVSVQLYFEHISHKSNHFKVK